MLHPLKQHRWYSVDIDTCPLCIALKQALNGLILGSVAPVIAQCARIQLLSQ